MGPNNKNVVQGYTAILKLIMRFTFTLLCGQSSNKCLETHFRENNQVIRNTVKIALEVIGLQAQTNNLFLPGIQLHINKKHNRHQLFIANLQLYFLDINIRLFVRPQFGRMAYLRQSNVLGHLFKGTRHLNKLTGEQRQGAGLAENILARL